MNCKRGNEPVECGCGWCPIVAECNGDVTVAAGRKQVIWCDWHCDPTSGLTDECPRCHRRCHEYAYHPGDPNRCQRRVRCPFCKCHKICNTTNTEQADGDSDADGDTALFVKNVGVYPLPDDRRDASAAFACLIDKHARRCNKETENKKGGRLGEDERDDIRTEVTNRWFLLVANYDSRKSGFEGLGDHLERGLKVFQYQYKPSEFEKATAGVGGDEDPTNPRPQPPYYPPERFESPGFRFVDAMNAITNEKHREAFRLRHCDKLTHVEIGERLGVSRSSADEYIKKAREQLEDYLIGKVDLEAWGYQ